MKELVPNHYEQAFENWLIDNRVQYVAVDERKKAAFGRSKVKSFDFLLYPSRHQTLIAELKGRLFKGKSLAGLTGMQCWVTADDIDGLLQWQKVFGSDYGAVFVFAYRMEKVDVDFDGREAYDFDGRPYVFFAVALDDYRRFMKLRSPKWKTVTLSAAKFREYAVQMQQLLF